MPVAQALVDADVGRVARPEVVAADDEDSVVGPIAEPLGQSCHESEHTGCSPGRGTCRPQAAPGATSVGDRGPKLIDVRDVGGDGEQLGVAVTRQSEVDEQAVGDSVDVGEESVVAIARLDVSFEANDRAWRQQLVRVAEASLPKHCTGLRGSTVSGVSMPMRRTRSSRPPTCTMIVSPSTTRLTTASPVPTAGPCDRPHAAHSTTRASRLPIRRIPSLRLPTRHTRPSKRPNAASKQPPLMVARGCDIPEPRPPFHALDRGVRREAGVSVKSRRGIVDHRTCAGSGSPPSSSPWSPRRQRASPASLERRAARCSRTTASGMPTCRSCPSIRTPRPMSPRWGVGAAQGRLRVGAVGRRTDRHPVRHRRIEHSEGARLVRLHRRERRRPLPDPGRSADRRGRAERRGSPRAHRRQGRVHALRAVRRLPAGRRVVARGIGSGVEPEVGRAPTRRMDLRRTRRDCRSSLDSCATTRSPPARSGTRSG